jgi:hypothetical protein
MVIRTKWFLALMLSTIFVLSIKAQYYVNSIFEDGLIQGKVRTILENNADNSVLFKTGLISMGAPTEIYKIFKLNNENQLVNIKDFSKLDQFAGTFGRTMKLENSICYYSMRDVNISIKNPDSVGWNYGIIDLNGNQILNIKIPIKPVNGKVDLCYGLELVKNNEVILWGIGIPPDRDPSVNDPYIQWVRLKKDGTFVSGPHYYKPPSVTTWAQPTDATLDIDSMMVMVYDSKNGGREKYVLKIREDDSVETMVHLSLGHADANENAKLCVTKDGHFMAVNYDPQKYEERLLTRINRENQVVWSESFDLPTGIVYGFNRTNVKNLFTNRIIEAANGDILMCGSNAVIDSFYIPKSNMKVLTSNSASSFIARFDKTGKLLWRHFLVDQHDDGKLNKFILNDITEMKDGSILVGGELGVKNDINRSTPFYMKLGLNGCFDDRCSHVDKWWYFPEEIVSVSDPDIADHKIMLYPNPGKDQVSILLPEIESNDVTYRYAVYDAKGQSHIQGVMQSDDPIIHTQFLPTGLYIITIRDNQGKISMGKWVKE